MPKVRDTAATREAKRIQPYCSRCHKDKDGGLHGHHIVALADGGPDTVENIDVLCGSCHTEWHRYVEGLVSYEDFIKTIPAGIMAQLQATPAMRGMTLDQVTGYWTMILLARRGVFYSDTVRQVWEERAASDAV